ncbi:MAG: NAD(P)/FAD-dependent oxidoreductase [Pseudomonadota bacterium]
MKIAIAGAGIGGLALAILLARQGHQVEVFDQFDTPAPVGSGLMLQETGLAVLRAFGLEAEAIARAAPISRLFGKTAPSDRTVLDVRFTALRRNLCAYGIQRSALFDVLYAEADRAGAHFTGNTEIIETDTQDSSFLTRSGKALKGFDLLVDALGANSPLSSEPRSELPFGALWATVDWPEQGPFIDDALEQRYRAARQMTGMMPSGSPSEGAGPTATYFWSIEGAGFEAWKSGGMDAWRGEAEALWPETAPIVQALDADALTFARYRHRTLGSPVRGRLVHIGDSWHATSPQLGQGANMALLDAYGLAKALEEHPRNLGVALKRYRTLRGAHVRLYQTMSWLFTPVYQSRGSVLPALRDWIAAPLTRVPPAPALLAAMVSGAFGSPLKRLELDAESLAQHTISQA